MQEMTKHRTTAVKFQASGEAKTLPLMTLMTLIYTD
jgi:hypothetical protein